MLSKQQIEDRKKLAMGLILNSGITPTITYSGHNGQETKIVMNAEEIVNKSIRISTLFFNEIEELK